MAKPRLVVVGYCTASSARILCCAELRTSGVGSGVARLAWRSADGATGAADIALGSSPPYATGVFDLEGLPSSAVIDYAIDTAADPAELPEAAALLAGETRRLRLLPSDRPLRVALVSCNRASDETDEAQRYALWERLHEQVERGRVDLIIHAGDQIYADALRRRYQSDTRNRGLTPADAARVDALTEEYRRLYVEEFWGAPEIAAVLDSCSSVMMWDDHEIYDGWGSNPDDHEPQQQAFFIAAERAFRDFQVSHAPPRIEEDSFACGFTHNGIGFLVLDARSHRMYRTHTVLGLRQHLAIARWLEGATGLRRLYVVTGIPPVHVDSVALLALSRLVPFTVGIEDDLRDTWVSPNNRNECRRLMMRLFQYQQHNPGTQVTLLCGDVHVGTIGRIESSLPAHRRRDGTRPRIYQVTSSGIGSKPPTGVQGWFVQQATRARVTLGADEITGRLLPLAGVRGQVLLRRHFAVLSLSDRSALTGTRTATCGSSSTLRGWRSPWSRRCSARRDSEGRPQVVGVPAGLAVTDS